MRLYTRIKDPVELKKIKSSYKNYIKFTHKNLILGNLQTRRMTFSEYKHNWVLEDKAQAAIGTPKARRHDNFARNVAAQNVKFKTPEIEKILKRIKKTQLAGETTFTFEYEELGSDKKLHKITKIIDITQKGRKLLKQFGVRDAIKYRISIGEKREKVLADYGY